MRRAEKLLVQALVVDEKALGAEHSNVGVDLWLLASVLRAIGGPENLERAKEKLIRAQAILGRTLGSEHPSMQRISGAIIELHSEFKKSD